MISDSTPDDSRDDPDDSRDDEETPNWQRIEELFEGALNLPAEQRMHYLAEACGDNTRLRRAVEDLLEVGAEASGFLSEPLAPTQAEPPSGPVHGGRFGPYRVLKPLGEGGMSTVYLAVRDDDTFRRRVAIKLIRHGMESREARRRLMVERQILASLDHPHIAKLFDAGTTAEGLPYFVMEQVEGLPIDVHCERHRLGTRECLELFQKVCAAVQYAHQNLVVHRDIKPSNLLVTAEGEPKLLDFGIAKLLNPDLMDPEHEPTVTGQRLLTPHYASPEQLQGEVITTASDVYSLGVLLYRLLTGRLPFRFEKRSPGEMIRRLTESEPPAPSTAVLFGPEAQQVGPKAQQAAEAVRGQRPSEVARELRGDLDQIVLKALRFSPRQRYASVDQLAADLERFAQGRPVLARDGGVRYRLGKLASRHWRGLLVGGAALVLFVAFSVQRYLHARQLEAALAVAEAKGLVAAQEQAKSEAALAFLVTLFERVDPTGSGEAGLTVLDILRTGEEAIRSQLADQPQVEALLRDILGTIYGNLELDAPARAHFERAIELTKGLGGDHRLDLARFKSKLGLTLLEEETTVRAEGLLRAALAESEQLIGREDPRVLPLLNNLVTFYCHIGAHGRAVELSQEAETLARQATTGAALRAEAFNNRAAVLRHSGDLAGAERLYREGRAETEEQVGGVHAVVATLDNNLGELLVQRGDLAEAERFHQQALDVWRQIDPAENFATVRSRHHLAEIRRMRGNLEGAEVMARQALEIYRGLEGAGPFRTLSLTTNLAEIWRQLGQRDDAVELLRQELANVGLPSTRFRETYVILSQAKAILGALLTDRKQWNAAERALEDSLNLATEIADQPGQRRTHELLITLYEAWGKPRKAEVSRQRVAALVGSAQ